MLIELVPGVMINSDDIIKVGFIPGLPRPSVKIWFYDVDSRSAYLNAKHIDTFEYGADVTDKERPITMKDIYQYYVQLRNILQPKEIKLHDVHEKGQDAEMKRWFDLNYFNDELTAKDVKKQEE